jgi:hypothetical protein
MRLSGASVTDLVQMLRKRGIDEVGSAQYLAKAFGGTLPRFSMFLEMDSSPEGLERNVGRVIDEHGVHWQAAPFPELMRLRDYLSFLEVAKRTDRHVFVCGANPWAGALIGEPGYRCYDGRLFVVSRESSPNAGAVAADPADVRLRSGLSKYATPLTYDAYVDLLRAEGLHVLGPGEGFVVEDGDGHRLYEPYRLHGVYERAADDSSWTGREGEGLRQVLNESLGAELVRFGPHDDWEHRNNRAVAGPLSGPQPPIIQFEPNGQIENHVSLGEIARTFPYKRIWSRLYPHHATEDAR